MKNCNTELVGRSENTSTIRENLLTTMAKNQDMNHQQLAFQLPSMTDKSIDVSTVRQNTHDAPNRHSVTRVQVFRHKISVMPTQFQVANMIKQQTAPISTDPIEIKQNSYDLWDLTFTFMNIRMPILLEAIGFMVFLAIRYYSMSCLIYIAIHSHDKDLIWIAVVAIDRVLFMLLVLKISLQIPQTRTQIVLKSNWNSTQTQSSQLFAVVNTQKLLKSILKSIVPAQFCFIYLRASDPRRRFQLYVAINYIYSSIEAVVYYPFFIIYCSILTVDDTFSLNKVYKNFTISLAALAEVMMVILTILLILIGIKKKYGKIFCCF